jgi:NitT/TauT family transport system substrate-binding protein
MTITLIENFRALFYAPFYAAHALGTYASEGVEVVLRASPSPAHSAAALQAGEADVMWGGPLRVMLTHDANPQADTVCFCDAVARDPFFIVGRAPRPNFRMADLVGPRVGIVSEVPTPWLCLQDDIRRAGIDPATLTRAPAASMADNVVALRDGRLEAVQVFQPYVEELVASGDRHIWYAAATRGLTAYTTLVTRRPVLAARRAELLAMTRAMARVLRWIAVMPGETVAETVQVYFPDVPPTVLAAAISRYQAVGLYAPDPILRREGYERLQAAMLSGGALRQAQAFDLCVDTSLAEQVVAEA